MQEVAAPVVVRTGMDAWTLLSDAEFLGEWNRLCEECPWAMPFQSPAYVGVWYESYRTSFSPVLVCQRGADGRLNGLLTLALAQQGHQLVVAGAHQAEYHMRRQPNLLHVTVMKLNDQPIAAHLGILGKDQVQLAMLVYSPFLARQSPGSLHLLMLGKLFVEEGIHTLDLTPGGDSRSCSPP